ncbi:MULTISPECIES: ABC transporter permease [Catenuloplanes]|uniref:ABC-2 type transport system permease protein n=1 Tax=Catenuloplanes niger TaxID=587534 RepID=A0AAE3ZPX6_9ACTN|nr:ABC transporter permease subunit [Catenuloplanes niger]MDR7322746.1 ABC-2 type transport system permease protein [Catenuloplanes niger]
MSVIHDIGYRRYQGPRLGRGSVFAALYVHGMRAAFGLGRTFKAKIFPWSVAGIMLVVGVVAAAVKSQTGMELLTYETFPDQMSMLLILFCAVVAPELVSRDLRSGVLPLYFSRPLSRADYPLAKLAAMVTASFAVLGVPMLIMFLTAAFSGDGMGAVWDETRAFAPGLAYALLFALVYSSIALLVSSFVSRRAVAAGATVAVFLVTAPVVGVLTFATTQTGQQLAQLASPATLVGGVGQWVFGRPEGMPEEFGIGSFGPLYGAVTLALLALCVSLLLVRYRKVAS